MDNNKDTVTENKETESQPENTEDVKDTSENKETETPESKEKESEKEDSANQEKENDNKLINHSEEKPNKTSIKNPEFLKRIVPACVVLIILILIICYAVGASKGSQLAENDDNVVTENPENSDEIVEYSAAQLNLIIESLNIYDEEALNKPTLVKYYNSYKEDGSDDELFYSDGYDNENEIIYTYSPYLDIELWTIPSSDEELANLSYDDTLELDRKTVVYYDENTNELKKYVSDFDIDTDSEIYAVDAEEYAFSFKEGTRIVNGQECYLIQLIPVEEVETSTTDEEESESYPVYTLVTKEGYKYVGTAIEYSEFFEYMILCDENDVNETVCKYTPEELHNATESSYEEYTDYVLSRIDAVQGN
jgi:hypothetical protein